MLFVALTWLLRSGRRPTQPAVLIGGFCLYYGTLRFLSDSLRVNDERTLGLTGAQYLMIALVGASIWILLRVRPQVARAEAETADTVAVDESDEVDRPDDIEDIEDIDDDGSESGDVEPDAASTEPT